MLSCKNVSDIFKRAILAATFAFLFFWISNARGDNAPMIHPVHVDSWLKFVDSYAEPENRSYLRAFFITDPCGIWSQDCIRTTKITNDILSKYNSDFFPLDKALILDVVCKARIAGENTKDALAYCKESLEIRTKVLGELDLSTAVSMEYLAEALSRRSMHIWNHMKLRDSASQMLDEAIELRKKVLTIRMALLPPDSSEVINSINNLRWAYLHAGRRMEAEPLNNLLTSLYASQIKRNKKNNNKIGNIMELQAQLINVKQQWSLAQVVSLSGNIDLSIEHGIAAVNSIINFISTRENYQEFKKSEIDFYSMLRTLSGWMIDAGRVAESQQLLNIIEQQEYIEFSDGFSTKYKPIIQPPVLSRINPLLSQRMRIGEQAIKIDAEIKELDRSATTRDLTDVEISKRNFLQNSLTAVKNAYQLNLSDIEGQVRTQSPDTQNQINALNLRLIQPLQATLKRLGNGTVLIHWVMLDHQTKVILTSPDAPPIVHTSPVGYKDLKNKIASLRRLLVTPGSITEFNQQSQLLYKLLLGPVENELRLLKAKTLMLAMHGELRYLPFSTLHDGEGYLIERYNLTYYSEAVRDRLRDQPSLSNSYAAFGLTSAVSGLAALPGVKLELEGVAQDGWLKGETLYNGQFDKPALIAALDRKPSILHLATHFVFAPGKEDKSYLLLGTGEKLPISDMQSLRFDGVDLVTLSACETAIGGGRDELGQEVTGLASVVQDNGAQAVMATLWKVSDGSTAQLVREFYRNRQQGKNKAEALRLAQINVMRGRLIQDKPMERGAVPVDPLPTLEDSKSTSSGWSHPYYWAPFILMGNWL